MTYRLVVWISHHHGVVAPACSKTLTFLTGNSSNTWLVTAKTRLILFCRSAEHPKPCESIQQGLGGTIGSCHCMHYFSTQLSCARQQTGANVAGARCGDAGEVPGEAAFCADRCHSQPPRVLWAGKCAWATRHWGPGESPHAPATQSLAFHRNREQG